MKVPREIEEAFYSGSRHAAIELCVNDSVNIIKGEHSGRSEAVISLQGLEPEPTFTIDLGDTGEDVLIGRELDN